MTVVVLLVSLPLAFLMGMAAQKGSICAVAAAAEMLDGKPPRQLAAILACSLWVLVVTVPLAWLIPRQTLAVSQPVTAEMLLGAALFGLGAAVNGGCAFSTLTRCSAGDIARAVTVAGMAAGLVAVGLVPGAGHDAEANGPSPLSTPTPAAFVLVGGVALAGLALLGRALRRQAWRGAWRRPRWNPFAATAVIGLAGGTLYAVHGPWMYTTLLPRALAQPVAADRVPVWEVMVLLLAVLAGGAVGAGIAGQRRLRFDARQAVRSMAGGILMGAGGALASGGNDVLVLHTMPALALHGAAAYAAMTLAMVLALALRRTASGRLGARRRRDARDDSPVRPR